MKLKALVGPLVGILVAIIIAVAVVIPVVIDVIGYTTNVNYTLAFGQNLTAAEYTYLAPAATVANLFPLLIAVLVLVGIAGYMTLSR